MNTFKSKTGFSLRAETGFSIPELMVVVTIIGILATLAMPRLRAFIARARQAEAKTLLAQIHTLQQSHQNLNDTFARWASTAKIGKGGSCTFSAGAGTCTGVTGTAPTDQGACTSAGGTWNVTTPGPFELGFKPPNCGDLRYGYWIEQGVDGNGIERYLAFAFAPSDATDRIYPTCDGKKSGRTDTINHPIAGTWTGSTRPTEQATATTGGDLQAISEDKARFHSDIIPNCE